MASQTGPVHPHQNSGESVAATCERNSRKEQANGGFTNKKNLYLISVSSFYFGKVHPPTGFDFQNAALMNLPWIHLVHAVLQNVIQTVNVDIVRCVVLDVQMVQ